MTRSILVFAVLSAVVGVILAAKGEKFIGNSVNASYPGQCYYKEEDVAIPIGSKYLLKKECEEAECRSDFVLRFETCPFYNQVDPKCERIQDKNAPFPKCCLTFKCPQ